jgi:hypothetical protein
MPYYRIVIWLKQQQKPIQGIRMIEVQNIDVVYNEMKNKAYSVYGQSDIVDVEVQMLSKKLQSCNTIFKGY